MSVGSSVEGEGLGGSGGPNFDEVNAEALGLINLVPREVPVEEAAELLAEWGRLGVHPPETSALTWQYLSMIRGKLRSLHGKRVYQMIFTLNDKGDIISTGTYARPTARRNGTRPFLYMSTTPLKRNVPGMATLLDAAEEERKRRRAAVQMEL